MKIRGKNKTRNRKNRTSNLKLLLETGKMVVDRVDILDLGGLLFKSY